MTDVFTRYFTEAEERLLFSTIKQHAGIQAERDLYWMQLARSSGVRLCVLAGLTVGDARAALDGDMLHVRPAINKRDKEQWLPLVKRSRDALQNLLRIHRAMSAGIEWDLNPLDRPLILSRNRRGMSERNFQDRMAKWVSIAGLPGGSPHWWRHTFAKRAMKNSQAEGSEKLQRVQAILGHDDPRTTQIYTRPDKEELRELMRDANA